MRSPADPTLDESSDRAGSELPESLAALSGAVRDLRSQAERLAGGLERMEQPVQPDEIGAQPAQRRFAPRAQRRFAPSAPRQGPPARADQPISPPRAVGQRTEARSSAPFDTGRKPLWPSLLAALALLGSVALLDVSFIVATLVAVATAIIFQVKWWMLALAALTLAGNVAIDSQVGQGPLGNEITVFILIFMLMAFALLLYELWERLRPHLSRGRREVPYSR